MNNRKITAKELERRRKALRATAKRRAERNKRIEDVITTLLIYFGINFIIWGFLGMIGVCGLNIILAYKYFVGDERKSATTAE